MRLIDADALIQEIREDNEGYYFNSSAEREVNFTKVDYAIGRISEALTIEARPKGRWIPIRGTYYCSCCKHYAYESQRFDFCQDCGAEMKGDSQ